MKLSFSTFEKITLAVAPPVRCGWVELTFRSTEALQLDAVVPVFQRVETGVKSETCWLVTLHRGARDHMGTLTTVLPMETTVVPLESSIVLFLENFSTSGSRPWDSFAPTKGNSLPAKRCRPVHIWSCLCLSEHKRVVLHDHFNSSVVVRVSLVWMECWRAASELN